MRRMTCFALSGWFCLALTVVSGCGKAKLGEEKTIELIQPVARVEMVAAAPVAASRETSKSGEQIAQAACVACHVSGVAGAPKTGDQGAWAPRLAQGVESLYQNVINGKNVMPARGGSPSLSDAELKAAVDYLVKQAR